jgi:hypothetical protein
MTTPPCQRQGGADCFGGNKEGVMRRYGVLFALICGVGLADESLAADQLLAREQVDYVAPAAQPSWMPRLSVVGTISGTWTDNALFTRYDRKTDWFFEPDISVRLDGRLAEDLTYRIYGRTEFERFSRVRDADAAFALWGGRLTRDIAGWATSVVYENRYQYAGVYKDYLFTANDVKLSVARNFDFGAWTFSPFAQGRYRFSNLEEAEYYRLDLALGIEARLNERWSIVSEPFYEAYWFTGGLNTGRIDQIYSVSIGLKYNFTPNVSLVTMVAFEERVSNVEDRKYRSLDIGPKLNFAF